MRCQLFSVAVAAALMLSACGDDESPSGTGISQLSIGAGVLCSDRSIIQVDGKAWDYPKGAIAPISPGKHTVSCKGGPSKEIDVTRGATYAFDKWD